MVPDPHPSISIINLLDKIKKNNANQSTTEPKIMAPPGSAHPAFGLGALTLAGGIAGYIRKNSKASLGAGVVCGSLLIASGVMISGDSQYGGHSLAAGTSGLMALGMGHRFFKTGKFMPSGLVGVLGAASLAYHVNKALEWKD